MDMKHSVYVSAFLLVACNGGSDATAPGSILIYADRDARQCESDGISPEASAQTLIEAGIDVLNSTCGIRTGVAFPTMCGAGTGDIVVHEIRDVNLPDAEKLGLRLITTLSDEVAGTGYQLKDCAS